MNTHYINATKMFLTAEVHADSMLRPVSENNGLFYAHVHFSRASESPSWPAAVFEHIMVEREPTNAVRRGNAEHVSERCYETHSLNGILTNSCLCVGKYLFSMEI